MSMYAVTHVLLLQACNMLHLVSRPLGLVYTSSQCRAVPNPFLVWQWLDNGSRFAPKHKCEPHYENEALRLFREAWLRKGNFFLAICMQNL